MTSGPTDLSTQEAADAAVAAAYEKQRSGDDVSASSVYTAVLRRFPRHAAALHYLGLIAQKNGRLREAFRLIGQSLALAPANPNAHAHMGHLFLHAGDPAKARQAFDAALASDAKHPDALTSLAKMNAAAGDMRGASALIDRLVAIAPNKSAVLTDFADFMTALGRSREAVSLLKRAIDADPKNAQAQHNLGVCFDLEGDYAAAVSCFERAIELDPARAKSLASLLSLPAYNPSQDILEKAGRAAVRADLAPDAAAQLHAALGKHADRRENFDAAFKHFTAANKHSKRGKPPFDARGFEGFVGALIASFDKAPDSAGASGLMMGVRPVFIVGIPRSGTSLVEQILASHPRVHGGGELQELPKIVSSLGPSYPGAFNTLPTEQLSALRRRYLDALEAQASYGAQVVTDKLPLNFLHLGVISALFPEAKIVHCRRDARDLALSCFIEQFDMPQDFSTSFEDFTAFHRQYGRLMAHWRRVLPLSIHDLNYEDLVRDHEAETRKLISFCGLPWSEDCLDFAATERAIATPSRWQVRQPLYASSVGRWKNYESQLAPLFRLLENAEAASDDG